MKVSGRVKTITKKDTLIAIMMASGEWVSQFFGERITPELKLALESVKEGEKWEFEVIESKNTKTGKKYLNIVEATKLVDDGKDEPVQPRGQDDRSEHIARAAGLHDAATVAAALITSKQECSSDDMIIMAKRFAKFTLTGE